MDLQKATVVMACDAQNNTLKHGRKLSRVLERPRCDPSVALLWASQPEMRKGWIIASKLCIVTKEILKCNIQSLLSLIMRYKNKCQSKCWVLKVRTSKRTHCER